MRRGIAEQLARDASGPLVRIADSLGGVSPPKYELLRGTIYSDTHALSHNVYELATTPVHLPSGAKSLPTGTLLVHDHWNIEPSISQEVVCIHEVEAYTHGTTGQVDWIILPFGGSDTTKTLLFKLYQNVKHRNDATFQAQLCKADKTVFGDPVTIHDPFAGTSKGFSAGHHEDAVGRCTSERDADTGATRLVVTHLESVAQYVTATLAEDFAYDEELLAKSTSFAGFGPDLKYLSPTNTIALFGNPATHGHLKAGDVVTAVLLNPDALDDEEDPRTEYVIVEGPSLQPHVRFAVVVTEAPKATAHAGDQNDGSFYVNPDSPLGECVLLEWGWHAGESEWRLEEMDIPAEGDIDDIVVPFINGDIRVPVKIGKVIKLQSDHPITPGMTVDDSTRPPVGTYAYDHDYLEALPGWSTGSPQVLYHDSSGLIRWGAEECEEE